MTFPACLEDRRAAYIQPKIHCHNVTSVTSIARNRHTIKLDIIGAICRLPVATKGRELKNSPSQAHFPIRSGQTGHETVGGVSRHVEN